MKVLFGSVLVCALAAGVGLTSFGASAAKQPPLCGLGQASTTAKPCAVNPAFAKAACARLAPSVTSLTGAAVSSGDNKAAPTGIACYYKIGGKPQQFSFIVAKPGASAAYAAVLKERQSWPAQAADGKMPGCFGNGQAATPVNAPRPVSGVGDKAFAWDQCSDGFNDSTSEVYAVKGSAFYSAAMRHWALATPTADQLVSFVRQLIAKYN